MGECTLERLDFELEERPLGDERALRLALLRGECLCGGAVR